MYRIYVLVNTMYLYYQQVRQQLCKNIRDEVHKHREGSVPDHSLIKNIIQVCIYSV